MIQKKRLPQSDLPNGPTRNAARRPMDARASLFRLQAGYPNHEPGAHGESILGRPRPAELVKPRVIARATGTSLMSGRRSRDKGARVERAIVNALQTGGFAAERVPLSGAAGGRYSGD